MSEQRPTYEELEAMLRESQEQKRRLAEELQDRHREITEAVERERAISGVLQAISRSVFDVDSVLQALTDQAAALTGALWAEVSLVDGNEIAIRAVRTPRVDVSEFLQVARYSLDSESARPIVVRRRRPLALTIHGANDPRLQSTTERDRQQWKRMFGNETMSQLLVPLMTPTGVIGTLGVFLTGEHRFTAQETGLLETFADQAVIAIENARLFNELQSRLDEQSATTAVLRIVGESLDRIEPVFQAIAEQVVRLCDADDVLAFTYDGEIMRRPGAASRSGDFLYLPPFPPAGGTPSPGTVPGAAILEGRAIHAFGAPETYEQQLPSQANLAREFGLRTMLGVPLMRGRGAKGVILARRADGRPFLDSQIALVEAFADQAVIAIENARLFNELQERNREVTEALERQTAMSEILQIIGRSPGDLSAAFSRIVELASRLAGAHHGNIWLVEGEQQLRTVATTSENAESIIGNVVSITPDRFVANAIIERRVLRFAGSFEEFEMQFPESAKYVRHLGWSDQMLAWLAIPLITHERVVGALLFSRRSHEPFADADLRIAEAFASQALIAIENARLFNELQERNREVTEALNREQVTGEILRQINRTPEDIKAILDAISDAIRHVVGASRTQWYLLEGDEVIVLGSTSEPGVLFAPGDDYEIERGPLSGEGWIRDLAETRKTRLLDDQAAFDLDSALTESWTIKHGFSDVPSFLVAAEARSTAWVPLLRNETVVGVFEVIRSEVKAFTDIEAGLLESFADQAAVAIENARLVRELRHRNREVTEALDQQTAMAEVLSIIASSATDVQPVLAAIVNAAARLCVATVSSIGLLQPGATEIDMFVRHRQGQTGNPGTRIPVDRLRPTGVAILERRTVHLAADRETFLSVYPATIDMDSAGDGLALMATPLLSKDRVLGFLSARRDNDTTPFTDRQIALLEAFADQAVIAIENARLFNELQQRNREVTEALEQQTAMADILQVISRSPTAVEPVLDAITTAAWRLFGCANAAIWRQDDGMLVVWSQAGPELVPSGVRLPLEAVGAGQAYMQRATISFSVSQLEEDARGRYQSLRTEVGRELPGAILATPLLRGDEVLGVVAIASMADVPYNGRQVAILETFADQAVIAIENARLFNELQERNREVTEALDQQAGVTDVLRVIGANPANVQKVFETLSTTLRRLVDADVAFVAYLGGGWWREWSTANGIFHEEEATEIPARAAAPSYAAAISGRPVAVWGPISEWEAEYPGAAEFHRARGKSDASIYAAPIAGREGHKGCLVVIRDRPIPYSDREIDLVQTFADQAVIAIENARLFNELQERNREVTEALDQQSGMWDPLESTCRHASLSIL